MQHCVAFTLTDVPVAFTLTGHNPIYTPNPLAFLLFSVAYLSFILYENLCHGRAKSPFHIALTEIFL